MVKGTLGELQHAFWLNLKHVCNGCTASVPVNGYELSVLPPGGMKYLSWLESVFLLLPLCSAFIFFLTWPVHTSLIFTVFIISDSSQDRHKHTHASLWLISPRTTYPLPPMFKISMVLSIFIWSFNSKDKLKLWAHWDMLTDSLLQVTIFRDSSKTRAMQFLLVNLH